MPESNTRLSAPTQAEHLISFIKQIHPLPEAAERIIRENCFGLAVKKGDCFITPETRCLDLYLLCQGVVRGYFVHEKSEITTWINEEGEVVGTITNLGVDEPSEEYLQALEDCYLIGLPFETLQHLYTHFTEMNFIGRLLLEDNYRGSEERAFLSRIPSATKRYQRFATTQLHLFNRIPLKYIASYLGMTVETLCRIRAREGKNNK